MDVLLLLSVEANPSHHSLWAWTVANVKDSPGRWVDLSSRENWAGRLLGAMECQGGF